MADERVTHTHPDDLTQGSRAVPQPPSTEHGRKSKMATQPEANCRSVFSLEDMDRVNALAIQATALLGVLSSAALAEDPPSGQETSNSCWAIKSMVEEMKGIIDAVWHGAMKGAEGDGA